MFRALADAGVARGGRVFVQQRESEVARHADPVADEVALDFREVGLVLVEDDDIGPVGGEPRVKLRFVPGLRAQDRHGGRRPRALLLAEECRRVEMVGAAVPRAENGQSGPAIPAPGDLRKNGPRVGGKMTDHAMHPAGDAGALRHHREALERGGESLVGVETAEAKEPVNAAGLEDRREAARRHARRLEPEVFQLVAAQRGPGAGALEQGFEVPVGRVLPPRLLLREEGDRAEGRVVAGLGGAPHLAHHLGEFGVGHVALGPGRMPHLGAQPGRDARTVLERQGNGGGGDAQLAGEGADAHAGLT